MVSSSNSKVKLRITPRTQEHFKLLRLFQKLMAEADIELMPADAHETCEHLHVAEAARIIEGNLALRVALAPFARKGETSIQDVYNARKALGLDPYDDVGANARKASEPPPCLEGLVAHNNAAVELAHARLIGIEELEAQLAERHTLDCDLVKHPNCTRCSCRKPRKPVERHGPGCFYYTDSCFAHGPSALAYEMPTSQQSGEKQ